MNKQKKYFVISICVLFFIGISEAVFSNPAEEAIKNEYSFNREAHGEWRRYVEDRFLRSIPTLEVPAYTLAEDFPQEHVKTFNDFLIFCASVEKTRMLSRMSGMSIVKARLELNNPVRYEDFLAAVILSITFVQHGVLDRMFEQFARLMEYYAQMFRFQSRNSFFIENILEPLSCDLETKEYRGYRFRNVNLPMFFRKFVDHCYDRRMSGFSNSFDRFLSYGTIDKLTIIPVSYHNNYLIGIPEEIYLANYYAQTFLLIQNEKLREAYSELFRYKAPLPKLEKSGLLPLRPYYYYSDEERYLWFKFLQA